MAAKAKRKKINKTKQTVHERVLDKLFKLDITPHDGDDPLKDCRVAVSMNGGWVAYASKAKPGEVPKTLGIVTYLSNRATNDTEVNEIDFGDGMHDHNFFRSISLSGPEPKEDWEANAVRELHIVLEVMEEFGVITDEEREEFIMNEERIFEDTCNKNEIEDALELLVSNGYTVTAPGHTPLAPPPGPEKIAETVNKKIDEKNA